LHIPLKGIIFVVPLWTSWEVCQAVSTCGSWDKIKGGGKCDANGSSHVIVHSSLSMDIIQESFEEVYMFSQTAKVVRTPTSVTSMPTRVMCTSDTCVTNLAIHRTPTHEWIRPNYSY